MMRLGLTFAFFLFLLSQGGVEVASVKLKNQDLQEQTESKAPAPDSNGGDTNGGNFFVEEDTNAGTYADADNDKPQPDRYDVTSYAEFTDAEKTKLNEIYSKAGYTEAQQAKCLRKNDPANVFSGGKRANDYCAKDTCEEITPSRFGYAKHWMYAISRAAMDGEIPGIEGIGVSKGRAVGDAIFSGHTVDGAKHSYNAYACIPRTTQCETLAGSDAHAWAQNKAMYAAGSCYPILWHYTSPGESGGVPGSPGDDGGLPDWAWGRSGQTESEQAAENALGISINLGSYVPKTPLEERGTACQKEHDPNKDYPCWRADRYQSASQPGTFDGHNGNGYASGGSKPLGGDYANVYDATFGYGEWLYWHAGGMHFPSGADYDGKTCQEKMSTFKAATLARWTYPNTTLYRENCIKAAGCSWDVQMGCAGTADVEAMAEVVCANVGALGTYWADVKRFNLAAIKLVKDIVAKATGGVEGVATAVCAPKYIGTPRFDEPCSGTANSGFSRKVTLDEVKQLVSDFVAYSGGYLMGDCSTIQHIAQKWADAVKGVVGISEAKLGKVPLVGPVLVLLARVVVLAQYTLQSKVMPEGSIFADLPNFAFRQSEAKAPVNMKQPGDEGLSDRLINFGLDSLW